MYTIVLLFNLEFFLKYQSRGIIDCYCMRFVLFEDLENVNPGHEFVCVCVSVCVEYDCLYWRECGGVMAKELPLPIFIHHAM